MHPAIVKYMKNDVGLYIWAMSHFLSRQYDMQTINIAKSMNSLLKHARSLPIIALTDNIRSLVTKVVYEHRELAAVRDGYPTELVQANVDE